MTSLNSFFIIDLRNLNCRHCGAYTFSANCVPFVVDSARRRGYKVVVLSSRRSVSLDFGSQTHMAFFESFSRVFRFIDNLYIFLFLVFWGSSNRVKYWAPLNTGPAIGLRFLSNVQVIVSLHDLKAFDRPDLMSRVSRLARSVELFTSLWSAGKVHCVSNFTQSSFFSWFPRISSRVLSAVIYEGAPSEIEGLGFNAQVNSLKGLSDQVVRSRKSALVIGVNRNKNLLGLVRALKYLEESIEFSDLQLELVIVGREDSGVTSVARVLDLDTPIRWRPKLSDSELSLAFSEADAFIFPSIYEGFGLPILEAASFGLPIVAADCTSVSEISPEGVFLIDPDNASSFGRAIAVAVNTDRPVSYDLRRFSWNLNSNALADFIFTDTP